MRYSTLCVAIILLPLIANAHWPYPCQYDPKKPHGTEHNPISHFDVSEIVNRENNDVVITAMPDVLTQSGDWVTVTISGVTDPAVGDFIAVYSPSDVDITKTSPVKYQFANYSKDFIQSGDATISFTLINMHADYRFVFFRNGTDYPIYIASSNVVNFTNYDEPLQGHIALTGDPTEMKVMWASGPSEIQYVEWGYSSGDYTNVNQSTPATYTDAELCGQPATSIGWRDPGFLHSFIITGIPPNSMVYYRFGSNYTGWSQEFSFASPIPAGPKNGVKVIAYGDMGKTLVDHSLEHWNFQKSAVNTTMNVLNKIEKEGYELVLHIGDIAYAVGWSAQWDEFMAEIQPVATQVPYMTLPGNHERDFPGSGSYYVGCDSGGECGVPYEHRFLMPNSDHEVQWYSFDFGNVHFVMMSTEHNFTQGSAQYEFLLNDLQSVDRSVTPWIVFNGHRPMYIDCPYQNASDGVSIVAEELQKALEDMLVKYEVNLVLWGHRHSYQRTCPVAKGECSSKDLPIHVIIGMAGFHLDHELEKVAPVWVDNLNIKDHGYSTIETTEKTLDFKFWSNHGEVLDGVTLHR